jgi:hypothetical protein
LSAVKCLLGALIVTVVVATNAHCQILLYNQPSGASPSGYGGVASGGIWTATYDDFVLSTSAQISGLSWAGFFDPALLNGVDNGYISAFDISFRADNAGQPGTSLYSVNIVGNGNETLSMLTAKPTYEYSVNLPSTFSAVGGVKYWVSVQPSLTYSQPLWYWYWMMGSGGDNLLYQSGAPYGNDLTFGLYSIPEPHSFSFVLLACLIFFCRRR